METLSLLTGVPLHLTRPASQQRSNLLDAGRVMRQGLLQSSLCSSSASSDCDLVMQLSRSNQHCGTSCG